MNQREDDLYQSLRKAIFLIVGLAILLWFVYEIRVIVLLFAFAFILAIVLNAPVTWLEGRRIRRGIATLAVSAGVLIVVILFSWIVWPRLSREVVILVEELPNYTSQLVNYVSSMAGNYPALQEQLKLDGETVTGFIPSLPVLLGRLGSYSFSFVGVLALTLVVISVTIYTVLYARPILEVYVQLLPTHLRDSGTRAFARGSEM
ncbi:MAG TPA: AI-2E family transporter, partial [Anaerolineae bacterium]